MDNFGVVERQGNYFINYRNLLIVGLLLCHTSAWALPTGEQLMVGKATVSMPSGTLMQINQTSQNAILHWQDFSIQQNEAVNIQQPKVDSALLNRVVGQNASQIQGKLTANGQVYLINPNGIIFGKNAQVDVGSLIATAYDIKNSDFLSGKNHFAQNSAKGNVENNGKIKASDQGVVALMGETVTNTGDINTPNGTTVLAAGKTVDLDFQGNGLVAVTVSASALNAQITNKGAIQADGGRVVMTAKAAGQLIDTVINQEGIVKAQGLTKLNGEIILDGDHVVQKGTLDVSGEKGGEVNIKAKTIFDAGKTNADGKTGSGGKVRYTASDSITRTAEADTHANGKKAGGNVYLKAIKAIHNAGKLNAISEEGSSTIDVTLEIDNQSSEATKQKELVSISSDSFNESAQINFIDTNQWLSQISPLQSSTQFMTWGHEKLSENEELLDIGNETMKLPIKRHTIIALSFSCSN